MLLFTHLIVVLVLNDTANIQYQNIFVKYFDKYLYINSQIY